jgi:hypothetical protein
MKEPTATCKTKRRLLSTYQKTTASYSQAVADLARKIGLVAQADYNGLAIATQKARRLSAAALEGLDAHIDEHGC